MRRTPDLAHPIEVVRRQAAVLSLLALGVLSILCRAASTAAQVPLSASESSNQSQPDSSQPSGNSSPFGTAQRYGDGGEMNTQSSSEDVSTFRLPSTANTTTLSAEAIINFLQENPDVAVELKSLAAERMQQQGSQLDANDISDEALDEQIQNNPGLRSSISTFFRARGYQVQDDQPGATDSSNGLTTSGSRSPGMAAADGFSAAHNPGFSINDSSAYGDQYGRISPNGSTRLYPLNNNPYATSQAAHQGTLPAKTGNTSTDKPNVLHRPAPYNLRSMRDLYTQLPNQNFQLKRFGSEVFLSRRPPVNDRNTSSLNTALDTSIGQDYVVGPGDTLDVNLWGGVTQHFSRLIGPDGNIQLPEAGSVQVAGLTLEHVQKLVEGVLAQQFRNIQLAVTIARLRSIRIYVVGDVQRPGGYDISSLATPITALYAAGGPTSSGSLRLARHLRGNKLIEEFDLYDFLLRGVRNASVHFEGGDTLLVPPAGIQAAVSGAVRRPAVYELKPDETELSRLLDDAGGLLPSASLSHIVVERIDAHQQRIMLSVPPGTAHDTPLEVQTTNTVPPFQVKDGDRVRVEPILPYSERAIYLEGHVVRPGRIAYSDGLKLNDVLHTYQDLLPEPADRAEIVRLVAPDLHAEIIAFNLPDVLVGNANLDLQPFDTLVVFSRYESDAPRVTISGEVLRPGSYPLSNGMTAAQLVRMAGGFKRDALLESAELTSYEISDGNRAAENVSIVPIGSVVSGANTKADTPLKAGDVLAIRQITGWNDVGQSITIEGQVKFPGSYGFKDGERLSSVLRRAGGLLPTAYPMGAILARDQVREVEQNSREELIRQIQANSASARLSPNFGATDTGATLELIKAQQDQVLSDLRSHPPSGRMVIHLDTNLDLWADTAADIELRRGDKLTIPKRPGFVLVTGQVYNSTALTFSPEKTAGWYLSHAGGTNTTADRKEIFIIRANGSVIGRHSNGHFGGKVLSTTLNPGDVVVVPQKIIGRSLLWKNLLATAQIASSIAITASVASL
jgi:protein involved in polysaccharide export with SLBB domain